VLFPPDPPSAQFSSSSPVPSSCPSLPASAFPRICHVFLPLLTSCHNFLLSLILLPLARLSLPIPQHIPFTQLVFHCPPEPAAYLLHNSPLPSPLLRNWNGWALFNVLIH
jgi:hypothetical protein